MLKAEFLLAAKDAIVSNARTAACRKISSNQLYTFTYKTIPSSLEGAKGTQDRQGD